MHGWQTSVQRLIPHPQPQQVRGESFYRQSWAEGWCPSRNSIVISNSHLQIIISGLISIILIVLGTVNLQFQRPFVHICGQFSKLWQLMSWVQSGHHVVNFSTWCFGIYKTTHRIWLRIFSIALEKEPNVLDYA